MKLFTDEQYRQLLENGKPENRDKDHPPVAHLYFNWHPAEWLISEIDPENPGIAFGLCDLGMGFPEMGYIDLQELKSLKVGPEPFALPIANNTLFEGKYPLTVYWKASKVHSKITRDEKLLMQVSHRTRDGLRP